ncbi:MAG: hypothetical protein KBD23_03840 [Gammaproteobacteria bacterium]|nr:hypothetical protein [Gammaproteobacteria bacterium]MBP9729254.1 hypothetical protein [Gammaproteobacteria bacterium]
MPEIVQSFFSFEAGPRQTQSLAPKATGIALNPDAALRLNSTEEYFYQQGFLTLFKLALNPEAKGCYRLDQHPCSTPLDPLSATIPIPDGIYSFVIVKIAKGFDLRIGLGGHSYTASKAKEVVAAGDLHFIEGVLSKITNQSGSYHIKSEDPLDEQRRQYEHALDAMQKVGLPMEKFYPFQEPRAKTLFFTRGSQAELPSRPCTNAAPRARLPAL